MPAKDVARAPDLDSSLTPHRIEIDLAPRFGASRELVKKPRRACRSLADRLRY